MTDEPLIREDAEARARWTEMGISGVLDADALWSLGMDFDDVDLDTGQLINGRIGFWTDCSQEPAYRRRLATPIPELAETLVEDNPPNHAFTRGQAPNGEPFSVIVRHAQRAHHND